MAAKKTAKKATKKTSAKKTSKAEETPKKKAKAVAEKPAKKGKKASKDEAPKKRGRPRKPEHLKAKRKVQSTLIKLADIPPKAMKIIQKADALELAAADAQEAFREQLSKIPEALGGASFEHPERGPMSVMERGYWFWRSKPKGK